MFGENIEPYGFISFNNIVFTGPRNEHERVSSIELNRRKAGNTPGPLVFFPCWFLLYTVSINLLPTIKHHIPNMVLSQISCDLYTPDHEHLMSYYSNRNVSCEHEIVWDKIFILYLYIKSIILIEFRVNGFLHRVIDTYIILNLLIVYVYMYVVFHIG